MLSLASPPDPLTMTWPEDDPWDMIRWILWEVPLCSQPDPHGPGEWLWLVAGVFDLSSGAEFSGKLSEFNLSDRPVVPNFSLRSVTVTSSCSWSDEGETFSLTWLAEERLGSLSWTWEIWQLDWPKFSMFGTELLSPVGVLYATLLKDAQTRQLMHLNI